MSNRTLFMLPLISPAAPDAVGLPELYPSARTIVRLRSATRGLLTGGPTATTDITHNFQLSVGFGCRF